MHIRLCLANSAGVEETGAKKFRSRLWAGGRVRADAHVVNAPAGGTVRATACYIVTPAHLEVGILMRCEVVFEVSPGDINDGRRSGGENIHPAGSVVCINRVVLVWIIVGCHLTPVTHPERAEGRCV